MEAHGKLSGMDVTFSDPVQPASLWAEDVRLLDPFGNVVPVGKPYHQTGYVYRIPVQQRWTPGEYQVAIGPGITDLVNNPMNQDGDLVDGEAAGRFSRTVCARRCISARDY